MRLREYRRRLLLFLWVVESLQMQFARCLRPSNHRHTLSTTSQQHQQHQQHQQQPTRRQFASLAGCVLPLLIPKLSSAAPPITQEEANNFGARTLRALRPKPKKILRPPVNKDFAVLLMRSSYNALDELDCVAMDQFQRDFFILRSAEYLPYVELLGPGLVRQGDLTDPYYLDFISYAQYAAIHRELTLIPPMVFTEKQSLPTNNDDEQQTFIDVLIKRDPSISNNMLAPEHDRRVGAALIEYLYDTYRDSGAMLPKFESKPTSDQVLAALSQLVKLFLINGYAWSGTAVQTGDGFEFVMQLQSPVTLWGGQGLSKARAPLQNDFILKAAKELCRRYGFLVVNSSTKYEGTTELSYLALR